MSFLLSLGHVLIFLSWKGKVPTINSPEIGYPSLEQKFNLLVDN
jgi:hypothetical protein